MVSGVEATGLPVEPRSRFRLTGERARVTIAATSLRSLPVDPQGSWPRHKKAGHFSAPPALLLQLSSRVTQALERAVAFRSTRQPASQALACREQLLGQP